MTSACVTVLTMWLWSPEPSPRVEAGAAASDSRVYSVAPLAPTVIADVPQVPPASVSTAPPLSPLSSEEKALAVRNAVTPPAAVPGAHDGDRTAPAGGEEGADLDIISEPDGARVTIDGVGWGTTPLTIHHLRAGDKRIRVTRPGHVSEERVVRVVAGATATVRMTLREKPPIRAAQ